ncbi:protein Pac2p [[Candida] jaroonii]|uniref:Protein Pac2p n=1 Tax=[Candida] jaroonii TaxID=467808 RepID=A0ACA9Y3L0_9ASCO|nr:protein Pac2p [[Candida] jaroonii]
MYRINDRLQLDDQLGTIRYIGRVGSWDVALGIEWDDASRGKNNGSVGGVTYFIPKIPNSVSFIKPTNKKILPRWTMEEGLNHLYGSKDEFEDISFGNKHSENFGFEKLNRINANFSQLMSISLDKRCIYTSSVIHLPKLKVLDLSYNLFTDISDIWHVLDQLPQLTELNLNGNRFSNIEEPVVYKKHNLQVLKLADTQMKFQEVKSLLVRFQLKELVLAGNNYTNEDLESLPKLDNLDLSYNKLTEVPDYDVKSMNLSNNNISSAPGNYIMEDLDLRINSIDSWTFLDSLYENSKLVSVRINNNPIFDGMDEEEITVNLISRLNCDKLVKINGSKISPEEIKNAELYFVSKVGQGVYEKPKKWDTLVTKYGDKTVSNKFNDFYYKKTKVRIRYEAEIFEKTVLSDYSILKVKGIVSSIINKPVFQIMLYYYLNNDYQEELEDILRLEDYNLSGEDLYVKLVS